MNRTISIPNMAPTRAVIGMLGLCAIAAAELPVETKPDSSRLSLRSEIDFGHVVKGFQSETGRELNMLPLNRNIVTLGTKTDLNAIWNLEAGFRSVIWWPFGGSGNMPHERIVRVEAELSVARLTARFTENFLLDLGYFPYKYNRDARNLGEYLHRSGTYPGYLITTDNLILMNGATPHLYGARLSLGQLQGLLTHDLTLFAETEVNPVGDFTPGYQFEVKAGILVLGGGLAYNHLLSFQPSKLRPNTSSDGNVYVEVSYSRPDGSDTVYHGPLSSAPTAIRNGIRDSTLVPTLRTKWTHKGIKLMGRASLDLHRLLPPELSGPEDLRIFAEIAMLGVQEQPYYYEDPAARIPLMFGINLPTFNLMDLVSIQVERYASPYINSSNYSNLSLPTWKETLDPRGQKVSVNEDDWKWSVYAKKSINSLLRVYLQVANDHIRTLRFDAVRSDSPLTQDSSHWYYLAKLEFGI